MMTTTFRDQFDTCTQDQRVKGRLLLRHLTKGNQHLHIAAVGLRGHRQRGATNPLPEVGRAAHGNTTSGPLHALPGRGLQHGGAAGPGVQRGVESTRFLRGQAKKAWDKAKEALGFYRLDPDVETYYHRG